MKWSTTFTLVFSILVGTAWSQNLEETKKFANASYTRGNYDLALQTLQRVAFFQKEQPDAELYYRIAECKYHLGNYAQASIYYDRSYYLAKGIKESQKALFGKIHCQMQLKDWKSALGELYNEETLDNDNQARIDFYKGIVFYALEDFTKAEKSFSACLNASDSLRKNQLHELFQDKRRLDYPNPRLARILSLVIPGMGQFYAGDYKNGFNSFLLNGGLIALAVNQALIYSPLDAILSVVPWLQRYYAGGSEKAELIAIEERERRRNELYKEVIALLQEAKDH